MNKFAAAFALMLFLPTLILAADTTPAVISNGHPSGILPHGTTVPSLSFDTNEDAICRFATWPASSFSSMIEFEWVESMHHTSEIGPVNQSGNYTIYIKCNDTSGNINPNFYLINFVISAPDTTPPILSFGSPFGLLPTGTLAVTLGVATNEDSTCRYDTTPNVAYALMPNAFTTTGGMYHKQFVSGLQSGRTYSYFVRCIDAEGNANTADYPISFTIAADTFQIAVCTSPDCSLNIPRNKMYQSMSNPNDISLILGNNQMNNYLKTINAGNTWSSFTVRPYLGIHSGLAGDSIGNIYVTDESMGSTYFRKINSPANNQSDLGPELFLTSGYIAPTVWTRSSVLSQDANNIWVFSRTVLNQTGNVRYFRSTDEGATFPQQGWVENTGSDNVRIGSFLINNKPAVVIWYAEGSAYSGWGFRYFIWDGNAFVANPDSTIAWGSQIYLREFTMNYVNNEVHVVYGDTSGKLLDSWKTYNNGIGSWNSVVIESLPYIPRDWHPILTKRGTELYLIYVRQESATAGNNNLYYRKWNSATKKWGMAIAVTTDGGENRFPQTPAVLAANSKFLPIAWSKGTSVLYNAVSIPLPTPTPTSRPKYVEEVVAADNVGMAVGISAGSSGEMFTGMLLGIAILAMGLLFAWRSGHFEGKPMTKRKRGRHH